MAYVTGEKILEDIPLEDEDFSVDTQEAQRIVEDWIWRVEEASGPQETAQGRYIVRLGASAEVLRMVYRRSGYPDTEGFDKEIARADKLLESYDASILVPGEPDEIPPEAVGLPSAGGLGVAPYFRKGMHDYFPERPI